VISLTSLHSLVSCLRIRIGAYPWECKARNIDFSSFCLGVSDKKQANIAVALGMSLISLHSLVSCLRIRIGLRV